MGIPKWRLKGAHVGEAGVLPWLHKSLSFVQYAGDEYTDLAKPEYLSISFSHWQSKMFEVLPWFVFVTVSGQIILWYGWNNRLAFTLFDCVLCTLETLNVIMKVLYFTPPFFHNLNICVVATNQRLLLQITRLQIKFSL